MPRTNYFQQASGVLLALIVVLSVGVFLLPCNSVANSFSIVFEKNNQPGFRIWESKDKDVGIDFPSNWPITSQGNDRGVTLSKAGAGWFRLRLIDLPIGETLAGFSQHLIDRSTSEDWDIEFSRDDGTQTIGGKACRVNQYRHKKDKRSYTGYNFLNSNGQKNKAYPVYIAYYPVNRWGEIKRRNDVKVTGPAQYTATDQRGNYTINLAPETKAYYAELYNANGQRWDVYKGLKIIKHSKASRFHHFKINN